MSLRDALARAGRGRFYAGRVAEVEANVARQMAALDALPRLVAEAVAEGARPRMPLLWQDMGDQA